MGNQQGLGKQGKQEDLSLFTNLCRGDAIMNNQIKQFEVQLEPEDINQNQEMIEMNASKDQHNRSQTDKYKTQHLIANSQHTHIPTKIRRVKIPNKTFSKQPAPPKQSQQNKKPSQQKKQQSSQQKFQQRIKDSLSYFKSLRILQLFQSKYKREYPVLILNKEKTTRELRKEIMAAKEKHEYFKMGKREQLVNDQEISAHQYKQGQHQQNQQSKQMYHMYQTLQKLQKNIIRIFQTGKHQTVLTHIKMLDQRLSKAQSQIQSAISKLQSFVTDLNSVKIQFMDMLYYQLSQKSKDSYSGVRKSDMRSISDGQVVNVKKMVMDQKEGKSQQYEEMKAVGFDLYKSNKVVFVIILGKNDSYLLQPYHSTLNQPTPNNLSDKQSNHRFFYPLDLPNNISLLQLLMSRYNAFAQLIQVPQLAIMLFFNPAQLEQLTKIIQANEQSWPKLNIITLRQSTIPVLDLHGNLVITSNGLHDGSDQVSFLKSTNGTGDLWDFLKENDNELGLRYLFNAGYQYIQVVQMGNCLQSGFDCFMLGYAHVNKLHWTTKVVQPLNRAVIPHNNSIEQSILYRTTTREILKVYPTQDKYHQIVQHLISQQTQFYIPTGHCIFSLQYIKSKILSSKWQKEVSYRKKLVNDYQNNRQLIIFQKDMSDIFNQPIQYSLRSSRVGQHPTMQSLKNNAQYNYRLFLSQRQEEYYPLLYFQNANIYDLESCSRALSEHYLKFLDISVERYLGLSASSVEGLGKVKCYIDPRVSLQGENLEEVKVEIEKRINEVLLGDLLVQEQDVENYSRANRMSLNRTYADYTPVSRMNRSGSRINEINTNPFNSSSYTTPFKSLNANKLHDNNSKVRSRYYYESQNRSGSRRKALDKDSRVSSEMIRAISSIEIQRREGLQQQSRWRQDDKQVGYDNQRPQVNIIIA